METRKPERDPRTDRDAQRAEEGYRAIFAAAASQMESITPEDYRVIFASAIRLFAIQAGARGSHGGNPFADNGENQFREVLASVTRLFNERLRPREHPTPASGA